jgi:hypothetical protein
MFGLIKNNKNIFIFIENIYFFLFNFSLPLIFILQVVQIQLHLSIIIKKNSKLTSVISKPKLGIIIKKKVDILFPQKTLNLSRTQNAYIQGDFIKITREDKYI